VEQQYRPLEIFLSDDNSPTSLEPLAAEFDEFQDSQFKIRYFRQTSNLGVSDNFTFAVNQATGKYLIPMSHDNWFTDKSFISEAVEIMEANSECYMCVANAVFENTDFKMLKVPDNINAKDSWEILEGDIFIRLWRSGGMGWTQIFVLDTQKAHSLGAFEAPFLVSKSLAQKLNVADDNVFAFVFVYSSIGSVALTGKVVCVVGRPEDSYSQSSKKWQQTRAKVKFIVFYNIYKAPLTGKSAQAAKEMAKKQAVEIAVNMNIFDLKIIQHYTFSIEVIYLMSAYMRKESLRFLRKLKKRAKRRIKTIFKK
jgi:glycosyltransferase involved in cell wall biosynthesis